MSEPDPTLLALLAHDPLERLGAALRAPAGRAGRGMLRDALLFDPDARVRAAAAWRLGALREAAAAPWLREAAGLDPRPAVREASFVALVRVADRGAFATSVRGAREDAVWWVRRAAVLAAAALGGPAALPALRAALDDPFWRVRHAAVQALAVVGEASPGLRSEIARGAGAATTAAAQNALGYLARRWGLAAGAGPRPGGEAPAGAAGGGAGAGGRAALEAAAFHDPDPAVGAARLMAAPVDAVDARALVELLGEPHEPLRRLALARLAASRDASALEGALKWLGEPQLPHAADAARALLGRAGDAALAPIAERALGADAPGGAFVWAAGWAAARGRVELAAKIGARAGDADARVRAAALRALARLDAGAAGALRGALRDADASVRAAAVVALAAVDPAAASGLRDVDGELPGARRAIAAAAARAGDVAALARGLGDDDALVRATSVAALERLGALGDDERRRASADDDPWVRRAALDAKGAVEALEADADPRVRRDAVEALARRLRELDRPTRLRAAELAATSADAWVRARGAALLETGDGAAALGVLLALSRDPSPAVRAAASDRLDRWQGLDARLLALIASPDALPDPLRAAAFGRLAFSDDAPGPRFEALAAFATEYEGPATREVLAALARIDERPAGPNRRVADAPGGEEVGGEPPAVAPSRTSVLSVTVTSLPPPPHVPSPSAAPPRPEPPASSPAPRPLGRTGLAVAPLGISGAYEPPRGALERAREAGVNLFFWEPRHAALTRFLRDRRRERDALVIAAGTYHADVPSIERDVATALRRLRTDRVDVFLLFWARSRARLSPEAFDAMARLKRSGAVRAIGFSTHDRALALEAIEARPWDVALLRHSAAHPGAERALLPRAARLGVGVVTFSALCYGRLLRTPPDGLGGAAPSAADCYRYTLSQPGVSACLSAPRRASEMAENLAVLARPELDRAALATMRAFGERVHAASGLFNELVRGGDRGAPGPASPGARGRSTGAGDPVLEGVLALLASAEGESEAFVEGRAASGLGRDDGGGPGARELGALAARAREPGARARRSRPGRAAARQGGEP
jgi:aryl-alcohol dehydrogenase-like predicted oxidoreductase/HEAT repeat protein